MADFLTSAGGMLHRAADYIFPALCIVCDSPRLGEHAWLCPACRDRLLENHRRRDPCPLCAMNRSGGACAHEDVFSFDSMHALFDYDDLLQKLVHQVKYGGKRRFTRDLAAEHSALLPPHFFDDVDAIVAVPLHPKSLRRRGYNQARLLAEGFATACASTAGPEIPDGLLIRVRNTPSQTNLDRDARRKNMKDAFLVKPEGEDWVRGKRLVLVDDVVTTGATTAAAAGALRRSGCASVKVLALARD